VGSYFSIVPLDSFLTFEKHEHLASFIFIRSPETVRLLVFFAPLTSIGPNLGYPRDTASPRVRTAGEQGLKIAKSCERMSKHSSRTHKHSIMIAVRSISSGPREVNL
jgi:hypothetical protein